MDEVACASLEEVRAGIDAVDRELVALLARRAAYVGQVVRFKRTAAEVPAPARAAAVIANARRLAVEHGADPDLAEHVYRAIIAWFSAAQVRAIERGRGG